jgi:hypothetical protein
MPLATYANFVAAARSNASLTVAQVALTRVQSATAPMPPAPATRASTSDIQAFQAWINAGLHEDPCTPPTTGGTTTPPPVTNPFNTPVVCTSGQTGVGAEGPTMRPGEACINCHTGSGGGDDNGGSDDGAAVLFTLAGTVYPTAHEPNDCSGANGAATGARVLVYPAGSTNPITLTPNAVGNFFYTGGVALPFTAKIVLPNGRERVMATPQRVGNCNSCHTQTGTTGAPGRIMLP